MLNNQNGHCGIQIENSFNKILGFFLILIFYLKNYNHYIKNYVHFAKGTLIS